MAIEEVLETGQDQRKSFGDHQLPETIEDENGIYTQRRSDRARSAKLRSLFLAAVMAMLVFTTVIILAITQNFSKATRPAIQGVHAQRICGTSPSEAQDRHCLFDIVSRFWVAQECFYPEIDQDFRTRMTSPYFKDINGTDIISREDLPNYTGKLFVRSEYHRLHCVFLLRRNHLAVKTGGKLAARMTSFEHTEHCTDILLEETSDPNRIGSIFDLSYPTCMDARQALSIGGDEGHHSPSAVDLGSHEGPRA